MKIEVFGFHIFSTIKIKMASSQNLYDYFEIVFDLSVLELKEKYPGANGTLKFWELKTEWVKQVYGTLEDEHITEEEFIKLMNIINNKRERCLNA
tara:strand:+ start:259 stop:543 length:285 start_codon:yes stop_codon:yes gene_type:complete